jgi:signal transduction histidine kinase
MGERGMGMLSDFVTENRTEIIARCRTRVAARMAPRPTEFELEHGIPLFLDQLAARLRSKLATRTLKAGQITLLPRPDAHAEDAVGESATKHGGDLLRVGFTVAQVVNDYGDSCQAITELAIERNATIRTDEFQALNLCLDEAIAGAVSEYQRQREIQVVAQDAERANQDLGFLAHELRNLLSTATLAYGALRNGSVGISGGTGTVLGQSLARLASLIDRSFAMVRLQAGIDSRERIVIGQFIEEVEVSAMMEARARGHQLTVEAGDVRAVVEADRQILASVVANLIQNAFKYSHPGSHVTLRTSTTAANVQIEVEDECGGLPAGKAEALFRPFEQRGQDRSGLGLGLAICLRGVETIGGTIGVRDLPGKGCVFTVALPRASEASRSTG